MTDDADRREQQRERDGRGEAEAVGGEADAAGVEWWGRGLGGGSVGVRGRRWWAGAGERFGGAGAAGVVGGAGAGR
jgi:hypothetical protein